MEQKNYLKLIWMVAFIAFAAVSCWATAESLHLLLSSWPLAMCWVVTVGFFIIASLGTKMIVDSLNQDIYLEKRGLRLVGGIVIVLKEIEVMKAYFIAILTLFTCNATVVRAQQMSELENRIDSLLNGKKATVGIAVWTDKGDMLRYNDHVHFPLLSVFKFHVALAVLDKMDKQSISLDSIVSIKASQMPPNTYSPLRKKFPDQDFTITLRELMQYSISQSDNNACDILIEYAGGIKHINDYIHRLSIDSFNLSETEDGMHSSFEAVYRNWSTPSAMVRLLRTADEKELFSNKELKDFLWQTMIDTETGANKLKGMLPAKTVVGHKTGSSDRNADGMKTADNDAGLVILPDGRKYYIAAFVMDSYETDEDNANIIARISRMVYDAMR